MTERTQRTRAVERRDFLRGTAGAGAIAATLGAAAATTGTAQAAGRATSRRQGPLQVHLVVYEGADELDFIAPYEVFHIAGHLGGPGVEPRYVTTGRPRIVTAAHGTRVRVDHRWAPEEADIILVPGGGSANRDSGGPGIWAEIERGVLPDALAEAAGRPGLTISSVCTGALILGAAGLVAGRPCTTHHRTVAELEAMGGTVKNARVVDDGDLVTAGGITSGLDLALWLVRRESGAESAVGLEEMLEYQARGTVWTPDTR